MSVLEILENTPARTAAPGGFGRVGQNERILVEGGVLRDFR